MINESEKGEIISIAGDLGEVAIDSILKDGLFKDIPIVGVGISVLKLINSASDRILLNKIISFINALNFKTDDEISDFKEKYLDEDDYEKIGTQLLLIIERSDSLIKIKWLAKNLRIFVDKKISKKEYMRLASIINNSYVDDFKQITIFLQHIRITSSNEHIDQYILDHLYSIGLLETLGFDGGDVSGNNSGTVYGLNSFGKIVCEHIL
jgi:hypothetical protein